MTIVTALQGVSRVFLDTAPVVYFLEQNPAYASQMDFVFDAIDQGSLAAVTSAVTLSEVLVQPIRLGLT